MMTSVITVVKRLLSNTHLVECPEVRTLGATHLHFFWTPKTLGNLGCYETLHAGN